MKKNILFVVFLGVFLFAFKIQAASNPHQRIDDLERIGVGTNQTAMDEKELQFLRPCFILNNALKGFHNAPLFSDKKEDYKLDDGKTFIAIKINLSDYSELSAFSDLKFRINKKDPLDCTKEPNGSLKCSTAGLGMEETFSLQAIITSCPDLDAPVLKSLGWKLKEIVPPSVTNTECKDDFVWDETNRQCVAKDTAAVTPAPVSPSGPSANPTPSATPKNPDPNPSGSSSFSPSSGSTGGGLCSLNKKAAAYPSWEWCCFIVVATTLLVLRRKKIK